MNSRRTISPVPLLAPTDYVVAARPVTRGFVSVFAILLVFGLLADAGHIARDFFAGAPLPVQIIGPLAVVYVAAAWAVYALRLHTVVRVSTAGLRIERLYPRLSRMYHWQDVVEWRTRRGGRGPETLRLTFVDGTRVTICPDVRKEMNLLIARLETLLPASGGRVRVGRRQSAAVATS